MAADRVKDERVVRRSERDLVGLCRAAKRGGITRRQFIERALVLGAVGDGGGGPRVRLRRRGPRTGAADPRHRADGRDQARRDRLLQLDRLHRPGDHAAVQGRDRHRGQGGLLQHGRGAPRQAQGRRHRATTCSCPRTTWSHIMLQERPARAARHGVPAQLRSTSPSRSVPRSTTTRRCRAACATRCPTSMALTGYCQRLDKVARAADELGCPVGRRATGRDQPPGRRARGPGHGAQAARLLGEHARPGRTRRGDRRPDRAEAARGDVRLGQHGARDRPGAVVRDVLGRRRARGACGQLGDDVEAKRALQWVVPEEGCVRWCDALVVPVGNSSRYGAHLFIDFLMRPDIAGQNASWVMRYLSPIAPASWEYTDGRALLVQADATRSWRARSTIDRRRRVRDAATRTRGGR